MTPMFNENHSTSHVAEFSKILDIAGDKNGLGAFSPEGVVVGSLVGEGVPEVGGGEIEGVDDSCIESEVGIVLRS